MKSAVPGSPRKRGPPRQAYQYLRVVPSASFVSAQFMPSKLTRMGLLLSPPFQRVVRRDDHFGFGVILREGVLHNVALELPRASQC
jgi:hypothetical protein